MVELLDTIVKYAYDERVFNFFEFIWIIKIDWKTILSPEVCFYYNSAI